MQVIYAGGIGDFDSITAQAMICCTSWEFNQAPMKNECLDVIDIWVFMLPLFLRYFATFVKFPHALHEQKF